MDNILAIDLILNKQKYSKIYNFNLIILIILLITSYIIFTYKYQTYYITKGKMVNNELELLVNIDDIKYIISNNKLIIDNTDYTYIVTEISDELYVDEYYQNYNYIYLQITNLSNINNYVYEIKIPKENKVLAKYLKNYL